ncbi:MAG: hypothetical protein M3347_06920 [Armatimonadota bacterium]|nr:hypothetical protein [Armatimonadota bacterium]
MVPQLLLSPGSERQDRRWRLYGLRKPVGMVEAEPDLETDFDFLDGFDAEVDPEGRHHGYCPTCWLQVIVPRMGQFYCRRCGSYFEISGGITMGRVWWQWWACDRPDIDPGSIPPAEREPFQGGDDLDEFDSSDSWWPAV